MRFASCVLVLVAGCFNGDATLGAVCHVDADCGGDQRCTNEVCGLCGDGAVDPREVCFEAAEAIPLGVAEQVAIVDLDQDAFADLVASGAGQVVPHLGGGFTPGPAVAVADVVGLHGGDVDGDALGDAVALRTDGFAVLFGDGAGGLVAGPEVATAIQEVVVDPGRGVVTAMGSTATLHAVQADRSLVTRAAIDVGVPVFALLGPRWFDEDATTDVAVVSEDGTVVVLVGTEEGYAVVPAEGFGEPIVIVVAFHVTGASVSDLIAVTTSGRLLVREGDGEGGFVAGASVDTEPIANALGMADINRDGEIDVIVAGGEGWRLHLQRAGLLQPATSLPAQDAVEDLVLTRTGSDPQFDLLAAGSGGAVVLRGDP